MDKNYLDKDLQGGRFAGEDLNKASFANCDLRGADFTGADLTGATFLNVRTGIKFLNTCWLFFVALIISLISGYVSMLTGHELHQMIVSSDNNMKLAGISGLVITTLFFMYLYWKGGSVAFRNLLLPALLLAMLIGLIRYLTGTGTGLAMASLALTYLLVLVMITIGTIARAGAGNLSSTILFVIVAVAGGTFGKSIGGGIGSIVMAVACALISKRALGGKKRFRILHYIASFITSKYGTSFRAAQLNNASFSGSIIRNADFSNADVSLVNWGDAQRINCIMDETRLTKD